MKMLLKLHGNCLSLRNTTYPLIVKLYGLGHPHVTVAVITPHSKLFATLFHFNTWIFLPI